MTNVDKPFFTWDITDCLLTTSEISQGKTVYLLVISNADSALLLRAYVDDWRIWMFRMKLFWRIIVIWGIFQMIGMAIQLFEMESSFNVVIVNLLGCSFYFCYLFSQCTYTNVAHVLLGNKRKKVCFEITILFSSFSICCFPTNLTMIGECYFIVFYQTEPLKHHCLSKSQSDWLILLERYFGN